MAAHKLVRFTSFETQLRTAAEKALFDATSSIAERRHARRVLADTLHEAQGRLVRKRAKDALRPRPAGGPELEVWRSGLKRIKAELVLDDPSSSLAQVRLAERTLKEIEQQERLRGIAPRNNKTDSPEAKPEPRTEQNHNGLPMSKRQSTDSSPKANRQHKRNHISCLTARCIPRRRTHNYSAKCTRDRCPFVVVPIKRFVRCVSLHGKTADVGKGDIK